MKARLYSWGRLATLGTIAGLAFNLWQRLLDALIDGAAHHVTWLSWIGD